MRFQFKNGNVIINRYSADGQKQRSDNYTRLTAITPVGENAIVNPENGYNDAVYSYTGTAYIQGFEYIISKTKTQGYGGVWIYSDVFNPNKIYTPEGYIDNLSTSGTSIVSNGVRYNYYRKDHLGNIREVWNGVRKNYSNQVKEAASTRQRTQYYPSGLPWAESFGAAVQKNKYNDKEFIEMHGLDEYDSEARWYYPAIMRTTTIDPLAEKFYDISPYVWCLNNVIIAIDPDGRIVKPYPGSDPSFIKSFNLAVKTLNSNGVGGAYNQLVKSKDVYYIKEGETSSYNPLNMTISWNPSFGVEVDGKVVLSPTGVIGHEFQHAKNHDDARVSWNKGDKEAFYDYKAGLEKGTSVTHGSKEEEKVISGPEQIIAKALGSIGESETTRSSHDGKLVRVEGINSIQKPEKIEEIQTPKAFIKTQNI